MALASPVMGVQVVVGVIYLCNYPCAYEPLRSAAPPVIGRDADITVGEVVIMAVLILRTAVLNL